MARSQEFLEKLQGGMAKWRKMLDIFMNSPPYEDLTVDDIFARHPGLEDRILADIAHEQWCQEIMTKPAPLDCNDPDAYLGDAPVMYTLPSAQQ